MLVADKNAQFALQGALSRPHALGIRSITYEFRSHPGRDGGVRASGSNVLAPERNRFQHALMLLDFAGCGTALLDPIALEVELDREVRATWIPRSSACVISCVFGFLLRSWRMATPIPNHSEPPTGRRRMDQRESASTATSVPGAP